VFQEGSGHVGRERRNLAERCHARRWRQGREAKCRPKTVVPLRKLVIKVNN
jgi:hypothetical protein